MRDQIKNKLNRHRTAVIAVYAVISILWIIFSDRIAHSLFNGNLLKQVQSSKGIFFVITTSIFLFFLIGRKNIAIQNLFDRLKANMKVFQDTFEQAAVGIAHNSPDEKWIRVNKKFCDMVGYKRNELMSLAFPDIIHPDDLEKGRQRDRELLNGSLKSYAMNKRYITKGGNIFYARVTKSRIEDSDGNLEYLNTIIEDVTSEQKKTEELKKSLKHREILLGEIHHRVKNNLAIISGLLELQAFNTNDEHVLILLRNSIMRIKSMALVHESFYKSNQIAYVAFRDFLKDFTSHIETTVSDQEKSITMLLDCQPVNLNINQAIPCGLLINELIISAFLSKKQAHGTILIRLDKNNEKILLVIKGENIGLSPGFDLENPKSLEATIVKSLINQLEADINLSSEENARISISFNRMEQKGASSATPQNILNN
ncbi:MAG: histidine kinase dimerization/phosphoacceptor domain -containing protein [Balneolaceae bacterium]|jgi:PAS domain S-box-containing protein